MANLHRMGKEKVLNHHHEVPYKVLEKQYTFGDEKNENKIIHGDNLEALKSLLPQYEGKIKCIYIDPPYNTGNEGWVYNDNVNHPKIKKWLHQVVGKEGEDLSRHDKWLCMMYPRLKLLHKLLKEDGVIFISIDDNEQANLKLMMDEIFGIQNFVGNLIWRKKEGGGQTDAYFVREHEYVIVYQKSNNFKRLNSVESENIKKYNKEDEKGCFCIVKLEKRGSGARKQDRPTMHFPIIDPTGKEYFPIAPDKNEGRWRVGKKTMDDLTEKDLIKRELKDGKYIPYEKIYYQKDKQKIIKARSILYDLANTGEASNTLTDLFGLKDTFDTPKPPKLIEFLIKHSSNEKDIILDSFAGSGTTAHAVLNLNKQDGGNRSFVLIEMEDYADNITAERVKRVINGYGEGTKKVEGVGGGFSYYELGQPLFLDEENLNEEVGEDKLREYIWYTETKTPFSEPKNKNKYFLGTNHDTDYYFFYEKNKATTLDHEFLSSLETKKNKQFVIYADMCLLSEEFMRKHNIIFKKIPRDITRF